MAIITGLNTLTFGRSVFVSVSVADAAHAEELRQLLPAAARLETAAGRPDAFAALSETSGL